VVVVVVVAIKLTLQRCATEVRSAATVMRRTALNHYRPGS